MSYPKLHLPDRGFGLKHHHLPIETSPIIEQTQTQRSKYSTPIIMKERYHTTIYVLLTESPVSRRPNTVNGQKLHVYKVVPTTFQSFS